MFIFLEGVLVHDGSPWLEHHSDCFVPFLGDVGGQSALNITRKNAQRALTTIKDTREKVGSTSLSWHIPTGGQFTIQITGSSTGNYNKLAWNINELVLSLVRTRDLSPGRLSTNRSHRSLSGSNTLC